MTVKDFIAANPDTWVTDIKERYSVHVVEDGDLVSLKYNQLESPMHEPIVQQCRGMVVDRTTNTIVAHPYNKFWNHGEALAAPIDWSTANVFEKLDGSLMILYYWRNTWRVASSGTPRATGSFGSDERTFAEAFWQVFADLRMHVPSAAHRDTVFMFELCDQPNRIVVKHDRPRIVLHGARDMASGAEYDHRYLEVGFSQSYNWECVRSYPIGTIDGCLAAAESLDPMKHEGFVVVDAAFNRVKIKSPRYVILHHMKGEATLRRAIELWQTGEAGELLSHFPEMSAAILPVHARLDEAAGMALDDVIANAAVSSRKEYAAAVKDKPWSAVCFKMFGEVAPSLEQAKSILRSQSIASLERLLEGRR